MKMRLFLTAVTAVLAMVTIVPNEWPRITRAEGQGYDVLASTRTDSSPYTLGYDTTRITRPLLPDGRPDYLTALNEMASKGVTKDNNAAVLIMPALDDGSLLGSQLRKKVIEVLGVSLPTEGTCFKAFAGHEAGPGTDSFRAYEYGIAKPWRSGDHPALASWVKENQKPLDTVRDATGRSRWYIPLVTEERVPTLESIQRPKYKRFIDVAEALVIRANLAAGEGRIEEALADLLAVYRFGILLDQDPTLVGPFNGISLTSISQKVMKVYATTGALSRRQAQHLAHDLIAAGALPRLTIAVDGLERFGMLSAIALTATQPVEQVAETLEGFVGGEENVIPQAGSLDIDEEMKEGWKQVNWNALLKQANGRYDEIVDAMKLPTFAERVEVLRKRIQSLQVASRNFSLSPDYPDQWTELLGNVFVSPHAMRVGDQRSVYEALQLRSDLNNVYGDLTILSLALCAFKAENGKYPDNLSALAPEFLPKVPQDFCSGKPFIYKNTAEGYILYSVGENMKDDGGKTKAEGGDDLIVRATDASSQPSSRRGS